MFVKTKELTLCACLCMLSRFGYVQLCDPVNCSLPGSSIHGNSPGKITGMDCHALLQGIFPTQGSNPGFPHCRFPTLQADSFLSEPPGKPKNTGVGSLSHLQGIFLTRVSCIAGRFFTSCAIGEAQIHSTVIHYFYTF